MKWIDEHTPLTRQELAAALRELRNEAHLDYMIASERASERAYDRKDFCERLAKLLGLDLGPLE